jgi:hypothetical protein
VYGDRDEESLIVREGQNLIRGFAREQQHRKNQRNGDDGDHHNGDAPLNHENHVDDEVELGDVNLHS